MISVLLFIFSHPFTTEGKGRSKTAKNGVTEKSKAVPDKPQDDQCLLTRHLATRDSSTTMFMNIYKDRK